MAHWEHCTASPEYDDWCSLKYRQSHHHIIGGFKPRGSWILAILQRLHLYNSVEIKVVSSRTIFGVMT